MADNAIYRDRPCLLDLFCGAGGASVGYHRAGFDVIGVDINPQPHYPFPFIRADATTWPLERVDAIHASPPCQAYSTMGNRKRLPAPELLVPILDRLRAVSVPWIVENVAGAARLMPGAVVLSGAMFGLRVHRPRYFLSNMLLMAPPRHRPPRGGVGVYGRAPDGRRLVSTKRGPYRAPRGLADAQDAMGMGWADWHGTKEAIPPAYTEFLGWQLLQHLGVAA